MLDKRKDFTTRESVSEINKAIEQTGKVDVRIEGKFKFIPKGVGQDRPHSKRQAGT